MVQNKNSQVVVLSGCDCLRFRNSKIQLTGQEKREMLDFVRTIRKEGGFRYILPLLENNGNMLRNVLVEILYIAVEKDSGHIYFITDRTGEIYLKRMLSEFHTDYTDLKINLLKYQKKKIHISTRIPIKRAEGNILVFFRTSERAEVLSGDYRAICILTLRDTYRRQTDLDASLEIFQRKGWRQIDVQRETAAEDIAETRTGGESKISIEICKNDAVSRYFSMVRSEGLHKGDVSKYSDMFGNFFMAVPIPLKWYEFSRSGVTGSDDFIPSMLPSQSVPFLGDIESLQRQRLQKICDQTEADLLDSNQKYNKILAAVNQHAANDAAASAVVMPNKIMADAFEWSLFQTGSTGGSIAENLKIFYPESLFEKSLDDKKEYLQTIFPFIPSPEMILVSQNLSDRLRFIVYSNEREILESAVRSANRQNSKSWFTAPRNRSLSIEDTENRSRDFHGAAPGTETTFNSYSRFISFLSDEDPKEDEAFYTTIGNIDSRHYAVTEGNGNTHTLRGWDSIVLFNEHETLPFRKYCWIHPRAIRKNDTLFLVPNEVRYRYLKQEITASLKRDSDDLNILFGYLAEWKKALGATSRRYSIVEVQKKLKMHGLDRNYLTIRNWFDGLLDDPYDSAVIAVIDSHRNIGPKNEDDIKTFGEVFDHEELKKHYREIHSAMKVFRANNQSVGHVAMQKIIRDFNEADIQKDCVPLVVKTISVLE